MAPISPSGSITEVPKAERPPTSAQTSLPFMPAGELAENFPSFHGVTGRSPAIRRLIQQMRRIAPYLTLATINGEAGTGKNLVARALHAAGPVAEHGSFVPCLATSFFAVPQTEPHSKWSAEILLHAHGGMLFLDGIHRLSPSQQEHLAEFLRWFEDCRLEAHPAGYSARCDELPAPPATGRPAQIICSSSLPLNRLQAEVGFRQDLMTRLGSIRFHLPPLTERREDIPMLAQVFIQRFVRTYGKTVRGLGPGVIAPLLRYSWPGNVRELENVITAAALETESQWIGPTDLPPLQDLSRHQSRELSNRTENSGADLNLDSVVRKHVAAVLEHTRGNKLRAAQLLGISRSTLYRILAAQGNSAFSEPQ